jgi:hemerythrin-like domain-containing protein
MNAIELLMKDHRQALALVDELLGADLDQLETADEETTAVTSNEDLFRRLRNALTVHTQIEEHLFYPALEGFQETREIVGEAYKEHQAVDQLLEEISELSPGEEWAERIEELRANLEPHIEEEENEMFPLAEELLGADRLNELGRRMEEMKGGPQLSASSTGF